MITKFPTWIKVGWTLVYQTKTVGDDNFLLHLKTKWSFLFLQWIYASSKSRTDPTTEYGWPPCSTFFLCSHNCHSHLSLPPITFCGSRWTFVSCLFVHFEISRIFSKSIKQYYSVCDISSFFIFGGQPFPSNQVPFACSPCLENVYFYLKCDTGN